MCAPYWPNEVGKTLNFNDYTVELLNTKEFEEYTQRELKLTKETVSAQYNILYYYYIVLFASKQLVTHILSSSTTTLGGQNMVLPA